MTIRVLGIETSCDETAAAVVSAPSENIIDGPEILSNIVWSQLEDHAPYGGVVPEIAARAHLEVIDVVIKKALAEATTGFDNLGAIAVTSGPGLAGGLIVGTITAQALSMVTGKPMIKINHLEGHALTARLTHGLDFPYLLLLVSGGHTQILLVKDVADYQRWATTIDDALGEAFDKTAKLLGLPYPGGPQVEKWAAKGDGKQFSFPRPKAGENTLDMSFSGLKTAVRLQSEKLSPLTDDNIADICASFQQAVSDVLADRIARAIDRFKTDTGSPGTLVIAGGVAANAALRARLETIAKEKDFILAAPPHELCTDNAAMIAWAGIERLAAGLLEDNDETLIRTRWPLDEDTQARIGGGKRGAKV